MWTDPIVAETHKIRADITEKVGDNSRALTQEAQRLAREAAEKFDMQWQKIKPTPRLQRAQ